MNQSEELPNNVWSHKIEFSWYDYCLFSFMLSASVAIGIYFGFFGKKQAGTKEYLLGGKTMTVFPIAMSLVASHVSGVTVLAIPADIYKYGSNYSFVLIGIMINCFIAAFIVMPVFHKLQITSTYEYLELRFNSKLRLTASFLYSIYILLYLPIVVYGPSLAFAQATSVNLHLINPIICAICIFYTTIGGLKAVVWTDTLQFIAMLGSIVTVLYLGASVVGGMGEVFNRALAGGRLDIDFDIDPTKRDTFWAVMIGWTINWISHLSVSQGSVQKFLALPTLSDVKKALLVFCIGVVFCKGASILTGLMIYAKYHDCDPFTINHVQKNDQLLPYYIMDVASKIPGLPGLFIAGVFCAALSTLSASMNSLAGIIYIDFIAKYMPKDTTEERVSNVLKLIVVIIGVVSTSLVYVVEHLGGILALSIAFSGITSGPLLGLFILGLIFPSANSKGALAGTIVSLITISWIVISNQVYKASGVIKYIPKPFSIDGCLTNITVLNITETMQTSDENVFALYRVTYYYYALIGALIVVGIGLPISWLTKTEEAIDERVITPWMRWAIPKTRYLRANTDDSIHNTNSFILNHKH